MGKGLLVILGGSLVWFTGAITGYALSEKEYQKTWAELSSEVAKVTIDFMNAVMEKRETGKEDSTKGEEE